jgi:hypothetical protein
VVPGAIPPEDRSSTLLILECFVLGVDDSLFIQGDLRGIMSQME